jgi:uncharacterized protein
MPTPTETDAAAEAIRKGDIERLQALLDANPDLANATSDGRRTMLHVATDWPGHYPRVAESIRLLLAAGANPNVHFPGEQNHSETPLHWAASSNDLAALEALLDGGADIEAQGAVIGGGSAIADAVAFQNWACARALLVRGAKVNFWQAAALGLPQYLRPALEAGLPPAEVTKAFWCACNGGSQQCAELVLAYGPDINWIGYDHITPLDAAARGGESSPEFLHWLRAIGCRSARGDAHHP